MVALGRRAGLLGALALIIGVVGNSAMVTAPVGVTVGVVGTCCVALPAIVVQPVAVISRANQALNIRSCSTDLTGNEPGLAPTANLCYR